MSPLTEVTIAEVDPTTADRNFWARYHAYRRVRHAEAFAQDPLRPDEVIEAQMSRPDPFNEIRCWEALCAGETAAFLWVGGASHTKPTYESNRRFARCMLTVHPDHRRRGLGTALLRLSLGDMDRRGAEILGLWTHEPSGHAFLKAVGAEVRQVERLSRMLVAEVDWNLIDRWVADGSRRNPDTTIRVIRGAVPNEMLAAASELV